MFKFNDSERFDRSLYLLSTIRLIVCLGQAVAIFYFSAIQDIGLELKPLVGILTFMTLFGAASLIWSVSEKPVSQQLFFTHLSIDIMALALMMYFSGGASNPFISYFLVPIAIGSSVLRWHYSLFLVLQGLIAYSALLFFYHPVHAFMSHSEGHGLSLHLLGMWLNFLVSAALIANFIVRMAQTIQNQQKELADRREQQLGTDRLVAVATLAANTAHQLSTPINSIGLLAKELSETYQERPKPDGDKQPTSNDYLPMLQTQIDRCKFILQNLVNTADIALEERDQKVPAKEYFADILDRWAVIHPEQVLDINQQNLRQLKGMLNIPLSLEPVIFNLLNNAAQSGGDEIKVDFEQSLNASKEHVCMKILDNGSGIPSELRKQIGSPFNSTKVDGMGIGLYLAFTTVESIGGELELEPLYENKKDETNPSSNIHKDKISGTQVRLKLPI